MPREETTILTFSKAALDDCEIRGHAMIDSGQNLKPSRLFRSGWTRLAVVSWFPWTLVVWTIIDENSSYHGWREDEYISFFFLVGIVPPLAYFGIKWIAKGFLDEQEKSERSGWDWRPDRHLGPLELLHTSEVLADGVYSHLRDRAKGPVEASLEIVGRDFSEAFHGHLKLASFSYSFGLTALRCEARIPGFIESQSCARASELAVEKMSQDIAAQGSFLRPDLPPKRDPRDAADELMGEALRAARQCLADGMSSARSPLFPLFKHLATTSCMWETDPQDPESLERDLGPLSRILWKQASDLMGLTD